MNYFRVSNNLFARLQPGVWGTHLARASPPKGTEAEYLFASASSFNRQISLFGRLNLAPSTRRTRELAASAI